MKVIAVCGILALAGCSQVAQNITENISTVVYTVVEPSVPSIDSSAPQVSVRPVSRPQQPSITIAQAIRQVFLPRPQPVEPVEIAWSYIGMHERTDTKELREFLGVNPRQTEWCAAFVNASIHSTGQKGSESVSAYPLLARSFLELGEPVPFKDDPSSPRLGDIAVFPRGRSSWQGHVGFYLETVIIDRKHYWKVLSGNQNNSVTVSLYPANRALGLRRLAKYTTAPRFALARLN